MATREELEFCSCDCERDRSPVLEAAPAAILPPIDAGTKLAGAVEVAAMVVERDAARTYQAWPLALELSTFARPTNDAWVTNFPVHPVDAEDAATLRAMREADAGRDDGDPLHVEQAGATYEVYVLEVVPARFATAIARFDDVTNPPPL